MTAVLTLTIYTQSASTRSYQQYTASELTMEMEEGIHWGPSLA